MKYVTFPSIFSFCMSLAMLFFVTESFLAKNFQALVLVLGMALVFCWFGFNPKFLTTNVFSSRFREHTKIEKSKYSYLLIMGILCLPVSFLTELLKWLK